MPRIPRPESGTFAVRVRRSSRYRGLTSAMVRFVASFGLVLSLGACSGTPATLPDAGVLTQWTLPAAPGSAEPFLSSNGDRILLSWLEPVDTGHALRVADVVEGGVQGPVATAVVAPDLFVNWADFPSVVEGTDGAWTAHFLQRGEAGGYDYAVRVVRSSDAGASWSEPRSVHLDGTPTEHGFVSLLPLDDGRMGALWLDGRRFVETPEGPATRDMTLRWREILTDGSLGPEQIVDDRVCECCQTGIARTARGWVAIYRNRTEGEVRDIHAARFEDGVWHEGRPVHDDGWVIEGCPVNGPAIAAEGDDVVVAWFTGANGVPAAFVAFSSDGGATFGAPVRIDDGDPTGRVDVVLDPSGAALVSWLERAEDGGEVRVRRVAREGDAGASRTIVRTSQARASGFPKMVAWPAGGLLFAWTSVEGEASRIELAHLAGWTGAE